MRLDDGVGDAIVQQRGEIVLRRREQGVLKIDDAYRLVMDHQIPAMVIAVIETGWLAVEGLRDGGESFAQGRNGAWW